MKRFVFGRSELDDPDWPVDHVPESERRGLWSISAVLLGFVFFAGTIYAGAEVGTAVGFGRMLGAMGVGYAILGAYVATLCAIGAKAGLTTVLLSRYTFGRLGAKWADLLLGGTQVGWFAATIPMVAEPTARFFGVDTPTWVAALILAWGVLHLATAYVGYDGMELLSKVAVPALVVTGLLSMGIALGDVGGFDGLFGGGTNEMAFGAAVTVVVGTFISGGTQAPNWARFARNGRVGFWAGLVAFLLGNGFLFFSGAVGGAAYDVTPAGDLYAVLAAQGLAALGLVALILNIWTTNDNTAYAFGVAGSEAFDYGRKRPFVLAGGAVGILLALTGVADALVPYLNLLGQYVPPLGGVIIADFLLCWRLEIPRMEDVEFAPLRVSALAGYVVGCAVAALTAGSLVPGVALPELFPGVASLNGLVASVVVHTVLYYGLERRGLLGGHDVADDADYC
ncbi:cytosine/purines uracil thiamine allantoin permease [Candidatus Halobonum tyrrellensis G22]|uniref:Cytosine/purines uracil thiamine allantoin permease n=1 Tax=Candidatus Halobonum tyrrellensis G22 TaxID=1324957 RepID=V4HAE4_9EURY|nr:cytosine/purines uracil thiamine allantoin permease [Candidatus Halobonum tyrrellensis G22]